MEQDKTPKYLQEVEEILKKKFPRPELSVQIGIARKMVALTQAVGIPSGDAGSVVAQLLKMASEEPRPLVGVYTGFRLGVAYERYQNANRTRKP